MKITRLLLLVAVAIAFSACCACRKAAPRSMVPLTGGMWQMVQLDGRSFRAEQDSYTLSFTTDNKVAGKGDCNRLTGSYTSDAATGKLSLSPMASTRMMCPNQATENQFLSLLNGIDAYTVDGSMLMLFSDGEIKLMFERK